MYFIELIIKKFTQKKEKPDYDPLLKDESTRDESCEHNFMPIDSTEEILSCINCGMVVKRADLKNKNFFLRDKID